MLRASPAQIRLTILDCCFAGQAIEALTNTHDSGLADITHVQGVYTLTATTRNRTAHVPPPHQQDTACTSFTGELVDLVRAGLPDKRAWLTLADIYPVLRQRLRTKGLPDPNQRGTNTADRFPFTANAAADENPTQPLQRLSPPRGNGSLIRLHESIGTVLASRGQWREAYQHLRSGLDLTYLEH